MSRLKKTVVLVIAAVMAFSGVVLPMNAYADSARVVEIRNKLGEAAAIQTIANVMKKCTGGSGSNAGDISSTLDMDEAAKGDIFNTNLMDTDIPVGAYVESLVEGEFDNGEIECNDNDSYVAKLFADKIGVDMINGIICAADGKSQGLYIPLDDDKNIVTVGCQSATKFSISMNYVDSENEYWREHPEQAGFDAAPIDYGKVSAFFGQLYENYRKNANNPYLQEWSKINDYTGDVGKAVGYWSYRNDFAAQCEGTTSTMKIANVDDNTGAVNEIEVTTKGQSYLEDKVGSFAGEEKNCYDLQAKLQEYASGYADILKKAIKDTCKEELSASIAEKLEAYQKIVDKPKKHSEQEVNEAKAYIEKWKDYQNMSADEFVQEDGSGGGIVCNKEAGIDVAVSMEDPAEGDNVTGDGSKSCFDGAGALGWVLCPILEGTSWAVNQLYSGFIEPALTINADLLTFDSNGDKGAYATWQTFQTFANIAFVIMILVVIFSQLTGVGIDNYGIKRILPRLIIAAILINLSFIICQLLVDLSNILGVSLKNLFNSLGPDYKSVGGSTGGAIFVDILVGVVAVGGAFLALGLGVLIPIIVAAISALIAIFFLFLVLAGRQAAVVILVVISPIALVMYMLPNTKKYFDKFVKIFVTLLVVFPVCGLLMGGGDFASRVLLQAGQASADSFSSTGEGFFYQISAVLVSIVPFFFIPSLVKGSLAGLGNIGSKISGIGSKVGGKASGKARSTLGNTKLGDPSRFRMRSRARQADRQNYKEIQFNRRRAGYDRDGNLTKRGRRMRRRAQGLTAGGLVMTRGQRERAQMRLDAAEATMLANERKLSNAGLHIRNQDEHVSSARAGMEAAEMDQQVKEQLALLRQRDEDGTVIADSPDRLGAEHADMLDRLNANPNDETAQARLRAVQSLLAGSDPGREHLSNNLDRAARSGQNTAVTIAASHLMEDHGGAIKAGNRDEEKWLQSAAGGNVQSRDNFSLQGLSGYTAQSLADADDRAHDALINNFKSMTPEQQETVRHLAWEMNNNPGINAKESVKQKFADLAKGYTPEPNRQEAELQNQTQILNDINDQLHHGPNGQQGTPPKPQPQPQPKDNGPSTEDWEDYTRGTGDFAP